VNKRRLTDEQMEALFVEYSAWLANKPKNLCKKYGLPRSTLKDYVRKFKERLAA
jgi:hypothetical protein